MDIATIQAWQKVIDLPAVILGIANIVFLFVLAKWHNDEDSTFDFRRALLDPVTKTISFSRLAQLVALVVSTGAVEYQLVKGNLSEWLGIGYMSAWAATYVASKYADRAQRPTGYSVQDERYRPPQEPPRRGVPVEDDAFRDVR